MKEINSEEILAKWISYNLQQLGKSKQASDAVAKTSIEGGSHWYVLEAMKDACEHVLYLAAENAKIKEIYNEAKKFEDYPFDVIIDKESILNTINQVK